MAPHYANVFMDNFEQNLLRHYSQKTGLSPLVYFRFIDDIVFIWTGNNIVIRNGEIVWEHGLNWPFSLYNLSSENYKNPVHASLYKI